MMNTEKAKIPMKPAEETRKVWITFLAVGALFLIFSMIVDYRPWDFLLNAENFGQFVTKDLLPPQITEPVEILKGILQTVSMAIVATIVAAVISIFLAFLGANATCPWKPLRKVIRLVASLQRNIPSMIWVFMLIMAFGIGNVVGVLALLIQSCGFLTRAFIETVDEIGDESLEAMKSVGAGRFTILTQVVIPACMTGVLSWVLYSLELNIRASTLVGAVGGGGIGLIMMGYIKLFRYHSAMAVILMVSAVVILVDALTNFLRKKVLA